jgi:hypothetical protein
MSGRMPPVQNAQPLVPCSAASFSAPKLYGNAFMARASASLCCELYHSIASNRNAEGILNVCRGVSLIHIPQANFRQHILPPLNTVQSISIARFFASQSCSMHYSTISNQNTNSVVYVWRGVSKVHYPGSMFGGTFCSKTCHSKSECLVRLAPLWLIRCKTSNNMTRSFPSQHLYTFKSETSAYQ